MRWTPQDWKPWFAWRPIHMQGGKFAWLEWVERSWHYDSRDGVARRWRREYRFPEGGDTHTTS